MTIISRRSPSIIGFGLLVDLNFRLTLKVLTLEFSVNNSFLKLKFRRSFNVKLLMFCETSGDQAVYVLHRLGLKYGKLLVPMLRYMSCNE